MDSQSGSQFTPPCPFCGHGAGRVKEVTLQHYERTVTFVCRSCDQTWTATDHVQSAGAAWEEQPSLKLI